MSIYAGCKPFFSAIRAFLFLYSSVSHIILQIILQVYYMVDGTGQLLNYAGCGTPSALVNCFLFTSLKNFFTSCNVGTYNSLLAIPSTTQRVSFKQILSFKILDLLIWYWRSLICISWSSGNTLNCNHPVVMELILDSLRHWYGLNSLPKI